MFAIISDLHSNLEALTAVLEDLDKRSVERIVCLGDVVGYGPEPIAVADLARERVSLCIRGNHDEALTSGAQFFGANAKKAIDWTRELLAPGFFASAATRERWKFLTTLPDRFASGPDLFIHGSPRDPTSEYVLAQEVSYEPDKYREIFTAFDRLLFVGHSHFPCVITEDLEAKEASAIGNAYVHTKGRAIVNVGSVGQPRDSDPRACYVIVDGERIEWRRVPYDVEATVKKVLAIPELPQQLGERLRVGR
jgi:diadenosine tetraphosphatase ApaH/serine/threonine PP2A family protein phosphatase